MGKAYKLSTGEKKLLLEILGKLVAANTVNPPGNEFRAVQICEKYLKQWGVPSQTFAKEKSRTNLVWNVGQGKEILIAAHSDTVPVGEGWQTDPFKMIRKNGKLSGRGVVDNKSPLAGVLFATKILKTYESELKNKIVFAVVADEELGNKFGMDFLLEQKVFKPTAAIIPDSCGNNREVEIAEKGVLQLRVKAFGQQGHGSMPEKSKNAIFILQDFLQEVRKLKFKKREKLLTPATISMGAFQAGTAANIIPGEAEVWLDIRYPLVESKKLILTKLKTLAKKVSKKWKVRSFDFEIIVDLLPSQTFEKHPLVQASLQAIQKTSRKKAQVVGMPAFTFGGVLRSRGVPVVGFGPGDLAECHRANEQVKESELYEFAEILIELFRSL